MKEPTLAGETTDQEKREHYQNSLRDDVSRLQQMDFASFPLKAILQVLVTILNAIISML